MRPAAWMLRIVVCSGEADGRSKPVATLQTAVFLDKAEAAMLLLGRAMILSKASNCPSQFL